MPFHFDNRYAHNDNTIGNAGFLPEIGLTGTQNNTVSNTHQEQFSGTIKDISGAQNSTLNLGIQLNWTLFDGFQMFVNKKMLRVLEDLGENGTRLVVEGTVSDIIMNYYGILQLKKMVQVMQEAVDLSVQRKRIVAAMLTFGAGSELMLLQSTVDLNADSTRLIREELLLANALIDLNRVLATDIHTQWLISDSIRIKDTLAFDDILARAIRENATLAAARLNQELMRLEVKNSQAGRYPEIGLTAGYAYNTLNSQTGFLKYSQSYGPSYGIILSYELFNGFNLNRTIKNAKLALNAGEIETKDAEQELTATLRKLFNEYLMNLQIIRMQLVNVRLAQENVDIAFEKYKLGSLDDIGLRETQNKLIDAQSQLILAQYEAKKAETEIFRLSGYFSQQGP